MKKKNEHKAIVSIFSILLIIYVSLSFGLTETIDVISATNVPPHVVPICVYIFTMVWTVRDKKCLLIADIARHSVFPVILVTYIHFPKYYIILLTAYVIYTVTEALKYYYSDECDKAVENIINNK